MIVNSFRTRAAICAAGAAVVAALTAGTAIGVADANDDAFVAAMQKAGWPVKNAANAPAMGKDVCAELAKGVTPDQIVATFMDTEAANGDFKASGVNVTNQMVAAMVSAAKQSYCP